MLKHSLIKKKYFSIILIFVFIIVVLFSGVSIKNTVLALTGDYNRVVSGDDQIEAEDWDNLDVDFLATDGSNAMEAGANIILNGGNVMGLPAFPANNNDAASKAYVDSQIASGITNVDAENLKMVCGITSHGSTNWVVAGANTVGVEIDTTAAGFINNNEVFYFASLYGNDGMYKAIGMDNIYLDATGFWLYLSDKDGGIFNLNTIRDTWQWYVKWCGIGK